MVLYLVAFSIDCPSKIVGSWVYFPFVRNFPFCGYYFDASQKSEKLAIIPVKSNILSIKGEKAMADIVRYRCSGCGWIYDPRFGDAANEVARGVVFENLPAKFICGVCGCPKAKFVKHDVLGGKPEVKKPEVKKPAAPLAIVALGSNLGNSRQFVSDAMARLQKLLTLHRTSALKVTCGNF